MHQRGSVAIESILLAPLLLFVTLVFLCISSLAVRQFLLHQVARDVVRTLAFTPELNEADMQNLAQTIVARRVLRPLSVKVRLYPVPVSVVFPFQRAPARVDIIELWVQYPVTFPGLERAFFVTATVREARVL